MNNDDIRLEHAFLTVRSLEQTLAYYRQLFPHWTVRWEGLMSDGGRWVHYGAPGDRQPSYLSFHEDPKAPAADEAYTSTRVQHLGFAHPDVSALARRLAAAGIDAATDPFDDASYRRSYYLDPDGHELEFVQQL